MLARPQARAAVLSVLAALAIPGTVLLGAPPPASAQTDLQREVDRRATEVLPKVIAWRRDIHQNPELGNRETRTSALVADHLRKLGYEVRTNVAHTGVVGILRGGKPGPVVALRADMDALPVTEQADVPFASKVRTTYNGQEVGVMHACGHDVHTAVLMGAAEALAGVRQELPGTVKLIFQPAEEGVPPGEEGGAKMMMAQGVLADPAPQAIFALHTTTLPGGTLAYKAGSIYASADVLKIVVRGRQTHAAMPWQGIDPVILSAQIILALQTIPSRQLDPFLPNVVTISTVHGGVRNNILPDEVVMEGTIRSLNPALHEDFLARIRRTAESIATNAGATAEVTITPYAPVTVNDAALTRRMEPTLQRIAGTSLSGTPGSMAAEDFSFFAQEVPGLYVFLGINPPGVEPGEAAPNHSPRFFVHEDSMVVGIRTMAGLAVDYLMGE
ncbi:MAG TPA: amidohydrolase [Thermoanaerobaculia bacterium]|nr:amidohydrolase [Thermoanaerobaculia bacterium]